MPKYLGLDLGSTTIGVAQSDILGFVHGVETFRFEAGAFGKARKHVHELVEKTGITDIVIGYPLNMDGSEGEAGKRSKRFMEDLLKENPNLHIDLQDERLTTVSAYQTLNALDVRGQKRKDSVDRLAACEILDFYIRSHGGK